MFKKVTKEEFEVLSKYHPWEIRYYVDMSRTVKPKRGKAKPKANGAEGLNGHVAPSRVTREWKGKYHKDTLIALGKVSMGNISANAPTGTIKEKITRAISELYHKNLFTQYRRSTLIEKVAEATKLTDPQINPVISNLINAKKLRVVQENASPTEVVGVKGVQAAH